MVQSCKVLRRGLAGWMLLAALQGSTAAAAPSDAELARIAQQRLDAATDAHAPGAAVLLARGDQVIFRGARGMAQMELGVPLSADQVFRIGSVTKQFSAATVLALVQQGKLSLDDPLSTFVPDYPNGAHITVHELLNHTSGVKSYTDIDGYMGAPIRADLDTAHLIAVFKDLPPEFAPGTDFRYDNSGYVLVGAIIEKVTGKPWYEAVREQVLAPHALAHTGYGGEQALIAGRAAGYTVDEQGRPINAPYISMTQPGAAGGLVSTVDDLFHWLRALHTGKVLDAERYQRLITPKPSASGKPTDYGYGVNTRVLRGERALEHGGRIPGFMSATMYVPSAAISVVVLTNSDSGVPDVDLLATRLAADALGKPYPQRHAITLTAAQQKALSGVYDIGGGAHRTVGVRDGVLYTQRDGGGPHPLLAASPDELYFNEVLDYFAVVHDAAGKVVGLDWFPDGEGPAQRQAKTSDAVPEAAPAKP